MLALGVGGACTTERIVTNSVRTAMQQLVVSEATDRALAKLRWPSFPGRRVFVDARAPTGPEEQLYLRSAAERELVLRGATVAPKRGHADLVAVVIAGALGTEQSTKFLGIPQMQSVLLPIPVPEVGLFKSKRQEGFARVETMFFEPHEKRALYHDGPRNGNAYWTEFSILLLGFYRTDTSRQPNGFLDTLKEIPPSNDDTLERRPRERPPVVVPPADESP